MFRIIQGQHIFHKTTSTRARPSQKPHPSQTHLPRTLVAAVVAEDGRNGEGVCALVCQITLRSALDLHLLLIDLSVLPKVLLNKLFLLS